MTIQKDDKTSATVKRGYNPAPVAKVQRPEAPPAGPQQDTSSPQHKNTDEPTSQDAGEGDRG